MSLIRPLGISFYFLSHTSWNIKKLVCCSRVTPTHCKANQFLITFISFNVNLTASKACTPHDIIYDLLFIHSYSTPDELNSFYINSLHNPNHNLLNTFVSLKHWSVLFSRSAPWFTLNLCHVKAKERIWNVCSRFTIYNNTQYYPLFL